MANKNLDKAYGSMGGSDNSEKKRGRTVTKTKKETSRKVYDVPHKPGLYRSERGHDTKKVVEVNRGKKSKTKTVEKSTMGERRFQGYGSGEKPISKKKTVTKTNRKGVTKTKTKSKKTKQ